MSKVYSIPMGRWVYDDVPAKVMAQPHGDPERFFQQCINLFPVVLAPADRGEIDGLLAITAWHAEPAHDTLKANVDALMRPHAVWPAGTSDADKATLPIPAAGLPQQLAGVPLLARWQALGAACHGTANFAFSYPQILQRRAFGNERVIGDTIHADSSFADAYAERRLSLFTLAAAATLMPHSVCQPDQAGPAWATHWADMRGLSLAEYLQIDGRFYERDVADHLSDTLTLRALPAGMHISMPTFMLHRAGGRHSAGNNQNGNVIVAHAVTSQFSPNAAG